MKRLILVVTIVLALIFVASCGTTAKPQVASNQSQVTVTVSKTDKWADNGVNAVYFPMPSVTRFVIALGEWQKENPDKELISTQSAMEVFTKEGLGGSETGGYILFYKFK